MIDRDKFVPMHKEYNFEKQTYLDDEVLNEYNVQYNALEYTLGVSTFLEWAEKDWQDSSRIVETETEKWWQQEKFQAAILFVSAGLFFIFVGFAAGETYLKEITDQLGQNTEALNTLQDQISQNLGGGN